MTTTSVGPSCAPLLPLEESLAEERGDVDFDAARHSQLHSHLDHPRHATTLTCLDARRLCLLSSGAGLRLFRHRRRPTVFVHLMGRVVGIEEKDKKVAWLVDDGSAVIAVHHIYQLSAPVLLSQTSYGPGQSRKGKEREMDDVQGGIPSEYRLPPPPLAPPGTERGEKGRIIKNPSEVAGYYAVGDLITVVGRMELWVDRKERVVFVDRALRASSVPGAGVGREEHEGYVQGAESSNGEPGHLLRALLLSATEYSKPFEMPEALMAGSSQGRRSSARLRAELPSFEGVANTAVTRPGLACDEGDGARKCRRTLRVMEDLDDANSMPPPPPPPQPSRFFGVTRRQMLSKRVKKEQVGAKGVVMGTVPYCAGQKQDDPVEPVEKRASCQRPVPSAVEAPRPQRQLRSYTKLSDSRMTESTFRVYVEKHLIDFCSGGQEGERADLDGDPPAFTLAYLHRVTSLREHAKRTVEVASKKREEKRRRKGQQVEEAKKGSSEEKVWDKMERLYVSVIRALLMDGIIVLAPTTCKPGRPFNGRRTTTSSGPVTQLDWEGVSDASISPSTRPVDADEGYRRPSMQEEAYQLVTPAILQMPLLEAVSRCSFTPSGAHLTQSMQAMDDRWRFITVDSVLDTLAHLQEKGKCK